MYHGNDRTITNDKGFIETGRDLQHYDNFKKIWKLERDPYLLETSCAGIFSAGDVRAGAMNRVASAVGEGSMAISLYIDIWRKCSFRLDAKSKSYQNKNCSYLSVYCL